METQRYPKQYTEALSQLGRPSWPLLAKSLIGENAQEVSEALKEYVLAFLSREVAKQSFDRFPMDCTASLEEVQANWTTLNLLRKDYEFSLRLQDKAYRKLMIAMLGVDVVDENQLAYVEAETETESETETETESV